MILSFIVVILAVVIPVLLFIMEYRLDKKQRRKLFHYLCDDVKISNRYYLKNRLEGVKIEHSLVDLALTREYKVIHVKNGLFIHVYYCESYIFYDLFGQYVIARGYKVISL